MAYVNTTNNKYKYFSSIFLKLTAGADGHWSAV